MTTSFILDNRAASGFQNASDYDTYRPSYPAEAVDKLLANLNVANQLNAKIVDLACGTGKFTELLAARPERFEVVGVEPHEGMMNELVKKRLEGVRVLKGNAGSIPVEEGWADVCVAAQAFHWFATKESLEEIHRVVRPDGAFGMVWNIEDYNAPTAWPSITKWEQRLKDIIASLEDGHPRFRHLKWREVFDQQLAATRLQALKDTFPNDATFFSLPIGEESVKWTIWLSDEAIWSRFSTLSQIANLDEEGREKVKKAVFTALREEGEKNDNGEVALHGLTYIAWTSRV